MSSLHQSAVSVIRTIAYTFGEESAQRGEPFAPEAWFLQRQQQVEFAHGFESIRGVTLATAQFTGSPLPKPPATVAATKRTAEATWRRIVEASEAHARHLDAARKLTAAITGIDNGDICFA
jgi:hypothetical protein